jgi:hypothetical protein
LFIVGLLALRMLCYLLTIAGAVNSRVPGCFFIAYRNGNKIISPLDHHGIVITRSNDILKTLHDN